MRLPFNNRFNTNTFNSTVHELENIPHRAAPRDDSVIQVTTDEEFARWIRIFGLSATEARFEFIGYRSSLSTYVPRPETIAKWPKEISAEYGFDKEAYGY